MIYTVPNETSKTGAERRGLPILRLAFDFAPFIIHYFLGQCCAASAVAYLISVDLDIVKRKASDLYEEIAEQTGVDE